MINPGISDHEATLIELKLKLAKKERKSIIFRNFKRLDTGQLAEAVIDQLHFSNMDQLTCDEGMQIFIDKHIELFNKFCPKRRKTFKANKIATYLTTETKELKLLRDKMYLWHKKAPTLVTGTRLKILNKMLRKKILSDTKLRINKDIDDIGVWAVKKRLFAKPNNEYVK